MISGIRPRELKELYRQAEKLGCLVARTRGGHIRVVAPDQAGVVVGPATSSDHRGILNTRAALRRLGVDL